MLVTIDGHTSDWTAETLRWWQRKHYSPVMGFGKYPTEKYPRNLRYLPDSQNPDMQKLRDQFQNMRGRHIYEADNSARVYDAYEDRYVAGLAALKWGDTQEVARLAALPPCRDAR